MVNFICRFLWVIISLVEKSYWYIWRNIQSQKFKRIGKNVSIGRHCYFTHATISIGNDVSIGQCCRFQSVKSQITIGNHVMFGPNVSIHGGNHRTDLVGKYMKEVGLEEKLPENDIDIMIGDDVWIGAGAYILNGVTIGEGSIIGAGCIVTHHVPPYTVLVGTKPQKSWERWNEATIRMHRQILAERRV